MKNFDNWDEDALDTRMNIIGQNGNDGLHYNTTSMKKKKPTKRKSYSKAKRHTIDGIEFKSGLEAYTYKQLKINKLFEGYENEVFTTLPSFSPANKFFGRQVNGKGSFTVRNPKTRAITYTPDFCGKTFIIECKGYVNQQFSLRWKLFKKYLCESKDLRTVYKPQSREDVDIMIELIKSNLKNNS